jgi:hypothetical protein
MASLPFFVLLNEPYLTVAAWLDAADLSRTDASCRPLLSLNAKPCGPWQTVGENAFFGMELDAGGGFLPFVCDTEIPWKTRYKLFQTLVHTFSDPFSGSEISVVEHPGLSAYFRCRLRPDHLYNRDHNGVYVEVEIRQNPGTASIMIADSDLSQCVTFSPGQGVVVRERQVPETSTSRWSHGRAMEGEDIRLLPAAPPGHRFEGIMGLYLRNGHVAFFRRWFVQPAVASADGAAAASTDAEPAWETTGSCTVLEWTPGMRLELSVACNDDGPYHVRIARVGRAPPLLPWCSEAAYEDANWNRLSQPFLDQLL